MMQTRIDQFRSEWRNQGHIGSDDKQQLAFMNYCFGQAYNDHDYWEMCVFFLKNPAL